MTPINKIRQLVDNYNNALSALPRSDLRPSEEALGNALVDLSEEILILWEACRYDLNDSHHDYISRIFKATIALDLKAAKLMGGE